MEALPPASQEGALLAEAFSHFIAASSRLEGSYRDLQAEVAELSLALSERNRALSASLSENEVLGHRLERVLETIPCGVVVVGDDGFVQLANPEAARLLALSSPQSLTTEVMAVAAPGLRLELHAPEIAEEEEQEVCLEGAEGPVWVAVRRVLFPAISSGPAARSEALFTLREISARKRMEEEREAARDAVALAQVSALLAHEIRNPLASLELFAGLLGEEPEKGEEWLSHLRAGIRSLSGTVNNVLALQGNVPLRLESVEVFAEVASAVEFLQPLAQQAEVALRFRAKDLSRSINAQGNRSAFRQILLNLCTNALRHTAKGGEVVVTCVTWQNGTETLLRVAVADSGCGIPEDHLPHLFKVGFSGSGASSGLGLAVCDRLARQMGGTIAVNSRVGQGSTFTLEMVQA